MEILTINQKTMNREPETITTKTGAKYAFYRTKNDINGNPRYIVSWLSLGLAGYHHTPATKKTGLRIYKGRDFGGGFVFQSYNLQADAEHFDSLGLKNV